ncbi:hypothetical protein J8273_5336 [Carpediemonas membranifera]|uniref:Ubiquitin carboxyl-terminal hydrolase n=1 Tax=Carpediemonas membranifera TaxID=201153 RepID=A0A8J6BWD8_9EUKA|nr:hypothetical protein J8273_5336 [Carpediemonas membranifera]|eukprot:KAG9392346.1 hypothetical protein J8273_5336 [Carpediemonas membranifera]
MLTKRNATIHLDVSGRECLSFSGLLSSVPVVLDYSDLDAPKAIGYGPGFLLDSKQQYFFQMGVGMPYRPHKVPSITRSKRESSLTVTYSSDAAAVTIVVHCSSNDDALPMTLIQFLRNVSSTRARWTPITEAEADALVLPSPAIEPLSMTPVAPAGVSLARDIEPLSHPRSPRSGPIALHLPPSASPIIPNMPKGRLFGRIAQDLAASDTRAPGIGLVNLGNTCYASSALQLLFSMPPFAESLLSHLPGPGGVHGPKEALAAEFVRLSVRSIRGVSGPGDLDSPIRIMSQLSELSGTSWRPGPTQDSHEFLTCLLQHLHFHDTPGGRACSVCSLFGVDLCTYKECHRCGARLELPGYSDASLTVRPVEGARISDLLATEMKGETITAGCDYCTARKTRLSRGLRVLPPVLFVHVSRMGLHGKDSSTVIVDDELNFPGSPAEIPDCRAATSVLRRVMAVKGANLEEEILDSDESDMEIDSAVESDPEISTDRPDATVRPGTYTLHGMVCHTGDPFRGHYTAYVKTPTGWVQYNDQQRSLVAPRATGKQVSICMYRLIG